jgi:tRNA-(ms[2]io[6]A)-hydroxylase
MNPSARINVDSAEVDADADANGNDDNEPQLKCKTDPAWIALALSKFDAVLVDHAHCEKKAAAHALSLLAAYPDVPGLARAMSRLAAEESEHLAQVVALLERRGLSLGRDSGDPYARGLQALSRTPPQQRLLDQLLISALIEARSRERLQLLADHLQDAELRSFYARLAMVEAGHGNLFVRLARRVSPEADARLEELLRAEAELLARLPLRAAVH